MEHEQLVGRFMNIEGGARVSLAPPWTWRAGQPVQPGMRKAAMRVFQPRAEVVS